MNTTKIFTITTEEVYKVVKKYQYKAEATTKEEAIQKILEQGDFKDCIEIRDDEQMLEGPTDINIINVKEL
jgi:hypothetical protein